MSDLLAGRIARDPYFICVSFCAVLYDQSHWRRAYDRGQPGFITIEGEPNQSLLETVRDANQRILDSVCGPLDESSIAELHRSYIETRAACRRVMQPRLALLKKAAEK